jgi:hypothetical protein
MRPFRFGWNRPGLRGIRVEAFPEAGGLDRRSPMRMIVAAIAVREFGIISTSRSTASLVPLFHRPAPRETPVTI